MQIFDNQNNRERIKVLKEIPVRFEYEHGRPAKAVFADGKTASISCLGCVNPKCAVYTKKEIMCSNLIDFASDQSNHVCPTTALSFSNDGEPIIDSKKCIKCGLCIRRCPVGALYFDKKIKLNNKETAFERTCEYCEESKSLQDNQVLKLSRVERIGVLIKESDTFMEEIYKRISAIQSSEHNIVGRNLLIGLGCSCAMRRIGDVYTRMDAFYFRSKHFSGAVEIEFGRDTLDASRGILDDIAVLHTRYHIHKNVNTPLVICLQLPNARQGYWQVVKDVKKVEKIEINTVTIGALLLLLWNNTNLCFENSKYYLDYDNMDLRTIIEDHIGRKVNISQKKLGILEPIK